MNKAVIFIQLVVLLFFFSSCQTERKGTTKQTDEVHTDQISKNELYGAWTQPIPGNEEESQGFILFEDGTAQSINMASLIYSSWGLQENRITFEVTSIGNRNSSTGKETMIIASLNAQNLVLKYDDWTASYTKRPDFLTAKSSDRPKKNYDKTFGTPNYIFSISAQNGEFTTIGLESVGLETEFNETKEINGQVLTSFMLDVNDDGFQEFYLVIAPTDDSGNLDLMAFASNRGLSISEIYVEDADLIRDVGTDQVKVLNGDLIRTYENDGKPVTHSYKLRQGEAGWILSAENQ